MCIVERFKNQKAIKRVSAIVLLSGGIDSAACVNYYLSQQVDTKGLFVDYGQPPTKREKQSAKQVAAYFNIKLDTLQLNLPNYIQNGEIMGRNGLLILSALISNPNHVGIISLGIHSGSPYYDCSESFVKDMNKILEGYANGRITLDTPFLKWNKKMIYEYCMKNNVPTNLTYSCENSGEEPCGRCMSCLDRRTLNASKKA